MPLCGCCSLPSLLCTIRGNNDHFSYFTLTPLPTYSDQKVADAFYLVARIPEQNAKPKKKDTQKPLIVGRNFDLQSLRLLIFLVTKKSERSAVGLAFLWRFFVFSWQLQSRPNMSHRSDWVFSSKEVYWYLSFPSMKKRNLSDGPYLTAIRVTKKIQKSSTKKPIQPRIAQIFSLSKKMVIWAMGNISSWIAKWNLGDGQYLTAIRVIKKIGNLSDGQYLTAIASTKISKKTRGSCKQRDLGPKYEFMPHFNKKRQGTYLRCFEIQNWGFFRGNFEFGNSTHPSTIKKKGKKVESQIFLKQIFFCASLCACCSRPSLLCPMRGNNDHFSHSTRTPLTHLLQPKSSRCILPRRKNPGTERKAKKKTRKNH